MQAVLKLVRDFANDALQLKILVSVFGWHGEQGGFERIQLEYDIDDRMTIGGGLILYQGGKDALLADPEENNRLFFRLSITF